MEADQTIFKQTVMENFNALNMKLGALIAASESAQNEGNGRKRKRDEDDKESDEGSSKKKDAPAELKQIDPQENISAKSFVLKHDFQKVSDLKEKDIGRATVEEHFGIAWGMNMDHNEEHLGLYLKCVSRGNYCIEISCLIELKNKSGTTIEKQFSIKYTNNEKFAYGMSKILRWEDLVQNYSINDTLTVKMHIQIIKMMGVYKENLRNFGPAMADCSDETVFFNNFALLNKF